MCYAIFQKGLQALDYVHVIIHQECMKHMSGARDVIDNTDCVNTSICTECNGQCVALCMFIFNYGGLTLQWSKAVLLW